jgi:hypothetical protein
MSETQKTVRHSVCIKIFRNQLELASPQDQIKMSLDLQNLERLGTRAFLIFLENNFEGFSYKHEKSLAILKDFCTETARRKMLSEKYTTSIIVRTSRCHKCGKTHFGYVVKLDSKNIPYVICGSTKERINVTLGEHKSTSSFKMLKHLTNTVFEIESYDSSNEKDILLIESMKGDTVNNKAK